MSAKREEEILYSLYEGTVDSGVFGVIKGMHMYGMRGEMTRPEMYIDDVDGNCWRITATLHPHKD